MSTTAGPARPSIVPKPQSATTSKPSWLDGIARKEVLKRLSRLENGRLILSDGGESHEFGQDTSDFPKPTNIRVLDRRFYGDVAFNGALGAGESYIRGAWECDDLTLLLRVLARNDAAVNGLDSGWAVLKKPIQSLLAKWRANTRAGSLRNIAAHYDLGNDFYSLMLDETMMYSSAIFDPPDSDLATAQRFKIERLCQKLRLQPTDHVVEIGCGWGGFAVYAALQYGCKIDAVTISKQQFDYTLDRVARAGVADRVTVLQKDYRDLTGVYNKLISIEMIEAVGHEFYPTFFRSCDRLLRPDGLAAIQAITVADRYYDHARKSVDFIKRYIFPGSCIPSHRAMAAAAGACELQLLHAEDFGIHYAETLRSWRRRVHEHRAQIERLGFTDPFFRMWDFYLCYCEAGFEERSIGVSQLLYSKPLARHTPWLAAAPNTNPSR